MDMLPVMPRMVQGLEGSQESLLGLLETSARIVNIVAAPGFGEHACQSQSNCCTCLAWLGLGLGGACLDCCAACWTPQNSVCCGCWDQPGWLTVTGSMQVTWAWTDLTWTASCLPAPLQALSAMLSRIASHRITSHHITSHHITSHHITSHHITSHHITSHHITSHHSKARMCTGKTMLASSVALHMVTGPQWGAAYWVDLHGCTNDRAAIFAFLAACGVPSDVPDAAALLAWLARVRGSLGCCCGLQRIWGCWLPCIQNSMVRCVCCWLKQAQTSSSRAGARSAGHLDLGPAVRLLVDLSDAAGCLSCRAPKRSIPAGLAHCQGLSHAWQRGVQLMQLQGCLWLSHEQTRGQHASHDIPGLTSEPSGSETPRDLT